MPSSNQIVMIVIGAIIILFIIPVLLARKGIVSGFKPVGENNKKLIVSSRNKIILYYMLSALFLVAMWFLGFIIRTVDIDVKLYNMLTNSFFISALICYVLSFVFLFIWCRLKCRKKWPWLLSFLIGAATIIPNVYLLFEVIKNSKADTPEKRG